MHIYGDHIVLHLQVCVHYLQKEKLKLMLVCITSHACTLSFTSLRIGQFALEPSHKL